MPNQSLVAYQTKAYNEVVGEYYFECSGGGAEIAKSTKIKGLKKGVKLHFLRYGLFHKKSDTDAGTTLQSITENKRKFSTVELSVESDQIPTIDQFYLTRTFLREGYLYIINKQNNSEYKEYYIDVAGDLTGIVWTQGNNGDKRTPSGNTTSFITIDKTGEYYIAFSPVQWSRSYFDSINADDAKKNNLMKVVNCIGVAIDSTPANDDVVAYKDIKLSCDKNHPNKALFRKNLKIIHIDEQKQSEKGGNEFYEDMFVTLHDPIGCAEDIGEILGDKILDFKALTEAIQTGEEIEDAKNRILNGYEPAEIKSDYADLFNLSLTCYKMVYNNRESVKEYSGGTAGRNFSDTHFPGQPSGVSYNTSRGRRIKRPPGWEPNEFHIGNGLDRQKVEGVLGVYKRKEYRDIVNVFRDKLGNFIKLDYFKKALHNYTENSDEYCIFGIEKVYTLLLPLFNNPYNIDRHLSLEGENVGPGFEKYVASDTWTEWVSECVTKTAVSNPDDHLEKLLVENKTIAQTVIESWIDLSNKLGAALSAKIEIHTHIAFKSKIVLSAVGKPIYQKILKDQRQIIIDKLNKIEIISKKTGQPVKPFHFGNSNNIQMKADLLGAKSDPNLEYIVKNGDDILMEGKADSFSHRMLYGKESIAKGGKNIVALGDEVENIYRLDNEVNNQVAKRYNEKAAKFVNSRGFSGVLFGLQVINLGNAVVDLSSTKGNSFGEYLKPGINTFGITGEFTEAMLNLRKAHLSTLGKNLSLFSNRLLYAAGAIGGAVTSAMCFWDASIAFGKHDRDKAIALSFAGVAFGVATGAGLITGSTVVAGVAAGALTASGIAISGSALALLLGPVGWIALGAGLVFIILANYFQDSELQFYFKNFLLNDHESYAIGETLPMDYNRKVLNNKEFLMKKVEDEDAKKYLMHPSDAMASLYDITVCNSVSYKVPKDGFSDKIGSGRSARYRVYKFAVEMAFNQLMKSGEQLEVRGILHYALDNNTQDFLLKSRTKVTPIKQEGGGVKYILQTTLSIPADKIAQIGNQTKLVVALRVSLDDNCTSYYPYPLVQKKERWVGARFGLTRGVVNKMRTSDQEVIFDSLTELRNTDTW